MGYSSEIIGESTIKGQVDDPCRWFRPFFRRQSFGNIHMLSITGWGQGQCGFAVNLRHWNSVRWYEIIYITHMYNHYNESFTPMLWSRFTFVPTVGWLSVWKKITGDVTNLIRNKHPIAWMLVIINCSFGFPPYFFPTSITTCSTWKRINRSLFVSGVVVFCA